MQIYGKKERRISEKKKQQKNKKKRLAVLRFEPPTAYMWTMYDNHHAIEVIINKCRFFGFILICACV